MLTVTVCVDRGSLGVSRSTGRGGSLSGGDAAHETALSHHAAQTATPQKGETKDQRWEEISLRADGKLGWWWEGMCYFYS